MAMPARAARGLAVAVMLTAGPAVAVDYVVTNCSDNPIAIYTYNDDDDLKLFPSHIAHIGAGQTAPVRCDTGTCVMSYAMEGGHSARPARTFSTDQCFHGWYSWSGAGNGSFQEGNCSMGCGQP